MPINFTPDIAPQQATNPSPNKISFIPDEHLPSPVQNLNPTMMDKILGSPALIKGLGYGENILSGLSDPKNILNRALGIRPIESTHFTEQDIKGGVPLPGPFIGAVNPNGEVSKPIDPNSIIGALRLLPDNVVDAITANPEQIALGGSGGVAALARKLMAIAMVTQGGSQVIRPDATPGERVRGGAQAVLGGLVGGIKEPVKPTTAQGDIEPSEFKKAGVESPEGNVIMPQYQNRPNAPQLNAPGINEAFARAQELEKTAKALQTPARQLPEKAQGPLEQAKQEALDKLQRSQELPSEGGFIAGKTKIAPAGDAVKVSELTRPIGFIEDRKPVVELPKEEPVSSKPPFISGAITPTGDVGVTPVTKEMLEASSGAKPPLNKDEAAKLFHDNLVTLGYAMRGEDQEHAQQLWKRNEQIKNDWFNGQTPEKPIQGEVSKANASTIRSDTGLLSKEGLVGKGSEDSSGENIQQAPQEGGKAGGEVFGQGQEVKPSQQMKLFSGAELPKEIKDHISRALSFVKQGNFTPLERLPDKPARVNPEAPTKLETTLSKAKTTPIESRDVSRAQPGEKLSLTDASKNVANNILNKLSYADKMLMPIDAIVDRLDSNAGDYKGWLQENVRKPIDDRFKYELNLRDSMLDPVTGLVKKYKMNEQNAERIGVYAHSLQKNGTERMLKSGVDQATIDKIVRTITPEEKTVYNTMRQMMDNSLPAVQSVMKELYNQDVKPVENYFPMPRDYNTYEAEPDSIAQGEFDEHSTWRQLQGDYVPRGAKTEQGFTITRKPGAKTAIKVNAFDIYQQHIRDVSHLIAMQKELHEIGKTVRRDMFKEKYGDVGQKLILDWLNTVARQGKSGKQIAFLDAIRNNTSKSVIGFRLASQLVHSANVPLAIQRAGLLNWSKGLSESLTDRGYDFLKENFPETFERGGGEPSLVDVSKSKGAGWAFGIQRAIDRANTQATVLGIYMKELAEKGKNPNAYDTLPVDKDAQSKALILARRAVASPLYKDIPPALARGGSLGKIFFHFQNTFLEQWSVIRHDLISAGIGPKVFKNPALASQLAVALGAMMLIETGIKFGAKNLGLVATGNQPEGNDAFWKRLETDALRRVPGAGQLMSEVLYGETGIPTVDVATGVVKGGIEATTGKKIGVNVKEAKTEKGKESQEVTREKVREQGLVNAITSALELAGIPGTSQISELIKNRIKASAPVKDNGNEKGNPRTKSRFKD